MRKLLLLISILISSAIAVCSPDTYYTFDGKLGSDIRFRLNLKQLSCNIISGQTTYYRKNGEVAKIMVVGHAESSGSSKTLVLKEFNGKRNCGDFEIKLSGDNFSSGFWKYLGKVLSMNEIEQSDADTTINYFLPATPSEIPGSYEFVVRSGNPNIGDYTGSCSLKTHGSKIGWFMHQAMPMEAEAEGESELDVCFFEGKSGDFEFIAYIDERFVYVMRKDHSTPLVEFGFGATLEGCYIK